MRAAVFYGPGRLAVEETARPRCGDDEVVLRMRAAAVCGTDCRIYALGQQNVVPPMVLGHEIAGEIAEIGRDVSGYCVGQRVTVVTCVGCGACRFCEKGWMNLCPDSKYLGYFYPGAFAEYMVVPAAAVKQGAIVPVPESMTDEEVTLIEPLSCCVNGQEVLSIGEGDTVVVIGAGPIGLLHTMLAKAAGAGATMVVEVEPKRLEWAKGLEGSHVIDGAHQDPVDAVKRLTDGRGADVIVVACASREAAEQGVRMAAVKGRVSLFAGLPRDDPSIRFDANLVHYREVSLFGAFGSHRRQFVVARDLIASGRVPAATIVTHRFALERILDAIETTRSGAGLKSVITFEVG